MKTLFLAWQNHNTRTWYPVGRLTRDTRGYRFLYTRGVEAAKKEGGFEALPSFPDLGKAYESEELFPLFANRVLSTSRPDYQTFVSWLGLSSEQGADPLELLERSGGQRVTDSLEVFPVPRKVSPHEYYLWFFVHGLRHMTPESINRANRLQTGERLLVAHDFQNPSDPNALILRTAELEPGDMHLVGFCPRYLFADTFDSMVKDHRLPEIVIEQVNLPPAPIRFRLLCRARMFSQEPPFSGEMFQPLVADFVALP